MSCIDRAFSSSEWLLDFPHVKLLQLKRELSDHCPLLLGSESVQWGLKPFRVLDCCVWILLSVFYCKMYGDICTPEHHRFKVVEKLSSLRIKLRKWNATTFGNLESKLKNTELRTITLESFNETRVLDDSEKDGLHFLNSELWPLSRKLESLRCQKSLTNWCKLEDFLFSRHL